MHTVIGSAVIFLCVWAFLSRVLLKPFLALIEEREARTVGDEHSAVEMKKDAKLLQAKAEEELVTPAFRPLRKRGSGLSSAPPPMRRKS